MTTDKADNLQNRVSKFQPGSPDWNQGKMNENPYPGHFNDSDANPPDQGSGDPGHPRLLACLYYALDYARRIVLSGITGVLDGEGLYFDVVGLSRYITEWGRVSGNKSIGKSPSVRLFDFSGPVEVVTMRFCEQIRNLCSPQDIPDPLTRDDLQKWAAAAQGNIQSRFAGWGAKIIGGELDAIFDQLPMK